jgi:hypothetical protein
MSCNTVHYTSPSLDAFQSLLKEIDDVNCQQSLVPTLDQLLQYTHALSSKLSGILNDLVRISSEGEEALRERMPQAIEEAADSITTLKELMLTIHRLRRTEAQRSAGLR